MTQVIAKTSRAAFGALSVEIESLVEVMVTVVETWQARNLRVAQNGRDVCPYGATRPVV